MEAKYNIPAEVRMEESYRIPVFATLVFVVTMIAIFFLGRHVGGYYHPVTTADGIEWVAGS